MTISLAKVHSPSLTSPRGSRTVSALTQTSKHQPRPGAATSYTAGIKPFASTYIQLSHFRLVTQKPKSIVSSMHTASAHERARSSVVAASSPAQAAGNSNWDLPATGTIRVVLIGVTGGTGRSALQGLQSALAADAACSDPAIASAAGRVQLQAVSRQPSSSAAQALVQATQGRVQVVQGDLEDPLSLLRILSGAHAVYCHALGKDARTADPAELARARLLADAVRSSGVGLLMYNSSGGKGCGYGITQMEMKHQVEDIFNATVPRFIALQATLFMEEFWKGYTRPKILEGSFPWSTPADKPIQVLAARDMGLAAGHILAGRASVSGSAVELAGDELTPAQMCEVWSQVQGTPVLHKHAPAWPFWLIARDVWRISRFLGERGYGADVAKCRRMFPGMLTFRDFMLLSFWAEPARTYASGITFDGQAIAQASGVKAENVQA